MLALSALRSRLAALLVLAAVVTACAGSAQGADQGQLESGAAALRRLQAEGAELAYTAHLIVTGGRVPAGRQAVLDLTATGAVRGERTQVQLRGGSNGALNLDLVIDDADVYVRDHGGTIWRTNAAALIQQYIEGLRLDQLRTDLLLGASSSGPTPRFKDRSLLHHLQARLGRDQLEELLTPQLQDAAQERRFASSASGTVDLYTGWTDGRVARYEIHLAGTDPATGARTDITVSARFSRYGKVAPIAVPADAQFVPAAQLLKH